MSKAKSPRRINFDHPALKSIPLNDKTPPSKDSISWKLWEDCFDIAQEALKTDFIQGIKNGTLDPNDYGQYTVQDCAYCYHGTEDYKTLENRAIEIKAPAIAAFAQARYESYESYYESEAKAWHVKDPSALQLSDAAATYIQYEKIAANDYHPIYGLIAMVPCDQLWPWLAEQLTPTAKQSGVYQFWIKENAGFGGAYRLDNFIDDWFAANPETYDPEIALYIYKCSMLCELNFFLSGCHQPLVPMPAVPNPA